MSQSHSNTWITHPTNRYKNGRQTYHFETPREVTVIRDSDTFYMNKIPSLGICAGLLLLNGIPIAVEGSLSVPRSNYVQHTPGDGQHGIIEIYTDNKI